MPHGADGICSTCPVLSDDLDSMRWWRVHLDGAVGVNVSAMCQGGPILNLDQDSYCPGKFLVFSLTPSWVVTSARS